ncbi:MAG: tRNA (adenosine(37)-N6)-threonylcarbamoyltransferase complex dimerization subunit type 1 TsaB [bacterium]
MTIFISIQGSYNQLEIALFKNQHCVQTIVKPGTKASSYLVPYLNELLSAHKLALSDLDFICVDKGPGAFTSLRVIIASVNGIGFARKTPLIGIDGLDALYLQTKQSLKNKTPDIIVSILNAYNNDVYYSINSAQEIADTQNQKLPIKSCEKITLLLEQLSQTFAQTKILFTGNAVKLHEPEILQTLGNNTIIDPNLESNQTAHAEQIGLMGYAAWQKQEDIVNRITPNYMKTQYFALKKN